MMTLHHAKSDGMTNLRATGNAGGESRLAGIEVALLTLRLLERWRAAAGSQNAAIVLLAVVAISAEKLTRAELEDEFHSLAEPVPADLLSKCNVSSIAAATGFNRETTRRYVNQLVEKGILERSADGAIAFVPGYLQREEIADLLQVQLELLSRSANELLRLGALSGG